MNDKKLNNLLLLLLYQIATLCMQFSSDRFYDNTLNCIVHHLMNSTCSIVMKDIDFCDSVGGYSEIRIVVYFRYNFYAYTTKFDYYVNFVVILSNSMMSSYH